MLAALLFAGLAAAAILPAAFDGLSDDDDIDPVESGGSGGKGSIEDEAVSSTEDTMEGTTYEVSATSGSAVLSAFDAACDSCTITTDTLDGEIAVESDPSGNGATLTYTASDGGQTVLSFPHLAEVPVDAISIRVEADASTLLPLSELFAAGEEIDEADEADATPLAPTDPDTPDTLPDLLDVGDVLSSIDPDLSDVLPTDLFEGEVLQPVTDALGLIKVDPATGLPIPVVVTDFAEGDLLSVTLSEAAAKGALEVTIDPAPSGEGVVVLVDGKAVALLPDAKELLPSQVIVALGAKGLI